MVRSLSKTTEDESRSATESHAHPHTINRYARKSETYFPKAPSPRVSNSRYCPTRLAIMAQMCDGRFTAGRDAKKEALQTCTKRQDARGAARRSALSTRDGHAVCVAKRCASRSAEGSQSRALESSSTNHSIQGGPGARKRMRGRWRHCVTTERICNATWQNAATRANGDATERDGLATRAARCGTRKNAAHGNAGSSVRARADGVAAREADGWCGRGKAERRGGVGGGASRGCAVCNKRGLALVRAGRRARAQVSSDAAWKIMRENGQSGVGAGRIIPCGCVR